MIDPVILSKKHTNIPEMQDDLIRLYDGPSDNLLAVYDRVAIQGRVLPKTVSYLPAAPNTLSITSGVIKILKGQPTP
jgi:hypothetical protein